MLGSNLSACQVSKKGGGWWLNTATFLCYAPKNPWRTKAINPGGLGAEPSRTFLCAQIWLLP
jgi:hypothetical protein